MSETNAAPSPSAEDVEALPMDADTLILWLETFCQDKRYWREIATTLRAQQSTIERQQARIRELEEALQKISRRTSTVFTKNPETMSGYEAATIARAALPQESRA